MYMLLISLLEELKFLLAEARKSQYVPVLRRLCLGDVRVVHITGQVGCPFAKIRYSTGNIAEQASSPAPPTNMHRQRQWAYAPVSRIHD